MRRILGAVVVALAASGCLVGITHVRDPSAAFRDARVEAERLQGRKGRAHTLHVLAYDPKDRELVRVSLPLWMVRKAGEEELDVDCQHEHARDVVKRHVRLKDLEKAGLGILIEVQEDGGERVLVWLS